MMKEGLYTETLHLLRLEGIFHTDFNNTKNKHEHNETINTITYNSHSCTNRVQQR
ncbi:hypothetical protein EMIT036CA2_10771 [Chryseobacterium sp. IT-36CA2]